MNRWRLVVVSMCSITLSACCCPGRTRVEPGQRTAVPGGVIAPIPAQVVSASDTITEATIQNVLFHFDDDIQLHIYKLRGRLTDLTGNHVIVLDDKEKLLIAIADAEVAITASHLTLLMNRYVFGYRGAPLRNLAIHTEGDHIVQTGVLHKIVDIPFEMTATLSATPEGMIRMHPTRMKICGVDGSGLLRALDKTLADLLDLRGATGVRVEGNDLVLDPLKVLPPPKVSGHLSAVRVAGNEIVQSFGGPFTVPTPANGAQNYMRFHGGTIRFGKLFMVAADLLAIDEDPKDAFHFYLDHYQQQLAAGHSVSGLDYSLAAYMPDFDELPSGRREGRDLR